MLKYINIFINIHILMNTIPDDNINNDQLHILDPLSVIIKLAIISNKQIGTKLRIDNNIIYIQEPGPFQAVCRFFFKCNKTHINYLYNPIEFACRCYLNDDSIQANPKIKDLFKCAQNGIQKLIETYKQCAIIVICLGHYMSLISNYLDGTNNDKLFRRDKMTQFYTNETITSLNNIWSHDKISIVLDLTTFLAKDNCAEANVKSLETIMDNIDTIVQQTIL
jgi:hypothetical protein